MSAKDEGAAGYALREAELMPEEDVPGTHSHLGAAPRRLTALTAALIWSQAEPAAWSLVFSAVCSTTLLVASV